MSATIVTDRSKNIVWYARKGDDQFINIAFVDTNDDPYPITNEEFTLLIKRFSGGNILTLEEGSGLTNGGASGILTVTFTDTQLDISPDVYLLFLKSENTGTAKIMTWLNGSFVLNGDTYDGDTTSATEVTVNTGAITVDLVITIGGGSGGSFEPVQYPDLEASGLPTGVSAGYLAQIVANPAYSVVIGGVQYYNNKLIYFDGTNWLSWSADYGTP